MQTNGFILGRLFNFHNVYEKLIIVGFNNGNILGQLKKETITKKKLLTSISLSLDHQIQILRFTQTLSRILMSSNDYILYLSNTNLIRQISDCPCFPFANNLPKIKHSSPNKHMISQIYIYLTFHVIISKKTFHIYCTMIQYNTLPCIYQSISWSHAKKKKPD